MPAMRGRRWPWLVSGGIAVALAVAMIAAASFLLLRDTSTPIDVQEVVDEFREGETPSGSLEGLPGPGVYVYSTEGFEEVDALAGTRHDYPPETTLTVAVAGCGVELRWEVLEERFESWELCPEGAGMRQPGYVSFHRFFGQPDTKSFVCTEESLALPGVVAPGASWSTDCIAGSLREVTTYEIVGLEDLDVSGTAVPVVHILTATDVSGSSTGSSEGQLWLSQDEGLPVRWTETTSTTSLSAIGPVHYDETFLIELGSMEPRR